MKILVTGAGGQLGHYLQKQILQNEEFEEIELIACTSDDLDITHLPQVMSVLNERKPEVVINAAAYTQVDLAEDEPELAMLVNATAVSNLAEVCSSIDAKLVQVSTDYVFDGTNTDGYHVNDQTNPINVYGKTKLAGEQYALAYAQGYVVRTSWVYSEFGRNFANTMRRLFKDREEIAIVNDQIGCPTHANNLAHYLLKQSLEKKWGQKSQPPSQRIYHYTDGEIMSWYELALKLYKEEQQKLALKNEAVNLNCQIKATSSESYPTKAKRPQYSILK